MSIRTVDSGPLHVKPEVDLNLNTEANRIFFVLNELINRSKLVGLLTQFIDNDGFQLKDYFDPLTLQNIVQTFEKYSYHRRSSLSDTSDSRESIGSLATEVHKERSAAASFSDTSSIFIKHKIKPQNEELSKVLYLLEGNPDVQKLVADKNDDMSKSVQGFINCLTDFKGRMEHRLTENAQQFKTREKYMRETYEKNERAKKEIAKLEEELVVTKTDANICLISKNILIKRHLNKIEKIKKLSQDVIENRVKQSENAMVNDWKQSMNEQERLQTAYQQASEKYSILLRDHLSTEKVLRAKRTKVENQVLGWIQKFDQDIGEKQAEEEEIQGMLDEENRQVSEIQKKLDEQEEEYEELMQEKAQYEEEMLERRMYHFIMYRSARRIQRSYRMYKAYKLAKKLAKKGKKEKKKKKE